MLVPRYDKMKYFVSKFYVEPENIPAAVNDDENQNRTIF